MLFASRAPAAMFFALFPAFFAYHTLLATGVMPPVLPGGGWTLINTIGLALLGPLTLWTLLRSDLEWAPAMVMHAAVAVLGLWVAAYAVFYARWGDTHQRELAVFLESVKLLAGWGALYCLGFWLRPDERFIKALVLCIASMAAAMLLVLDSTALRFPQEGGATYHWFANAVAFSALLCLPFSPPAVQAGIIAGGLSALFVIGSRAEFFGFAAVTALWGTVAAWRNRPSELAAGLAAAIPAVLATLVLSPYLPLIGVAPARPSITQATQPAQVPNQVTAARPKPQPSISERQFEITELAKSESFQHRQEFLRKGWAAIKASPVTGDYGGQMRGPDGAIGHYIHNALSAWRQFGLVPFLIYVVLCFAPPVIAGYHVAVRNSDDPMWLLTLYVGAFTLLLVLAVKPVFWALPALAWGLLAQKLSAHAPVVARQGSHRSGAFLHR